MKEVKKTFRNDINGLRAIAVFAVVIFHFNSHWLPGGFTGVDVFFVISGFLMTRIVFNGLENNSFSIFSFYLARANRIIPALAILCIFLIIFGWFYLPPIDYKNLGDHVASSILFYSNINYWLESGYFRADSYEKWLLHTWSLSVEWQFYIIYPLILVIMKKFMSFQLMRKMIVFVTILGFLFCVFASHRWANASFYLLPTRAWEMLVGGIAFLFPFNLKAKNKQYMEALGFCLIIGSYIFITEKNIWPGYLSTIPVLGAFFIIQSQRNNSLLTNNYISQKIGLWSYSIYLWHWPFVVLLYDQGYSKNLPINIGFILISILFGWLSYSLIENKKIIKPDIINFKTFLTLKPVIYIVIVSTISVVTFMREGFDIPIRSIARTDEAVYVKNFQIDNYFNDLYKQEYRQECNFYDGDTETAKISINASCTNSGTGGVFLWGDSHAQALSYGIRQVLSDNTPFHQVATAGCRPLIKNDSKTKAGFKISCDKSNAKAKTSIIKNRPEIILLAQADEHDENNFAEILHFIKTNKINSKLVLIGPVPQWKPSLPKVIIKRHFKAHKKIINDPYFVSNLIHINGYLHDKYDNSEIEYISIIDQLCDKEGCLAKMDNKNTPLVWDYGHLTLEGSAFIANKILKHRILPYLSTRNTTNSA